MSKKLQVLKDLKCRLEEDPGRFVKGYYRTVKNGKICYCVIGHLLNIAGWNDTTIEELEKEYSSVGIGYIFKSEKDIANDATYLLTNLGFTLIELENLQIANDQDLLLHPDKFDDLKNEIDQMIKKEESQNDSRLDGETSLPEADGSE